jgi:hypothetical protein
MKVEIAVSMSEEDAARFMRDYSEGKLAEFGLVTAKIVGPVSEGDDKTPWTSQVRPTESNETHHGPQKR